MNPNAEFDVIIYGATGFTGRLVAEYMNNTYGVGGNVTWAMAGRSEEKLTSVRDEMGIPNTVPFVVADASDPAQLTAMATRGKCILTTVGPYTLYGEPLVKACAETGTDYVDLSGEVLFMKDMIEKYDETAKASGARIVHSCGFDSIPFDLGVYYLQHHAKEKFGKPLPRVKGRMRQMQGTFSGGTAASGKATLAAVQANPALMQDLLNPFSLTEGFKGPDQPAGNKVMEEDGVWVAPFVMAVINTKNIHRSNALLGHSYGEDFVYDEMMMTGPGDQGKAIAEAVAGMEIGGKDAPKPGEGPSKKEREAGHYDFIALGSDGDGHTLNVVVTGDKDPGYGSTSKIIAESALCLVKDCANLAGGIYTPAPAMGLKLVTRLVDKAGLTFDIEG